MVIAPASMAMSVSEAAGWTTDEVPQTKSTSQRFAASRAESHASSGKRSPNQTTPGRILAPQDAQRGGSMRAPAGGSCGMSVGWAYGWWHVSQ
jgi:hypothetical protein